MTRWARSGSTQKHKKMPGDATKWGEFDNISSPQKQKKIKSETNSKQSDTSFSAIADLPQTEDIDSTKNQETFSKKLKNKVSLKVNKSLEKNQVEDYGTKNDVQNPNVNDKHDEISLSAKKEKKKAMHLKKLQKKRADKGIMLLPSKVERKLYYIKKKLREKGVPPPLLKEIVNKERRKAELKFRKTFNPSKLCFHCRKPGHMLADCPQKLGSSRQETGICFKCGSAEHTSFKCPEKVQGFPFAKCFICKEQGHISKDCPRNKHGVYPKGGRCNLCGNVNHLRQDCPSLSKKKAVESIITLHTIKAETSIDAEVIEKRDRKKENVKKPKIVKF